MPAYLREIWVARCSHPGCRAVATHELHNAQNALIAAYCRRHGDAALVRVRAGDERLGIPDAEEAGTLPSCPTADSSPIPSWPDRARPPG